LHTPVFVVVRVSASGFTRHVCAVCLEFVSLPNTARSKMTHPIAKWLSQRVLEGLNENPQPQI